MQGEEEQKKKSSQIFFIIEHLQSEFSDWCKCEYMQIIQALNDKFSKTHESRRDCKTKVLLMNMPDWRNQIVKQQFKEQRKQTLNNWDQFNSFNKINKCLFISTHLSLNQYLKSRIKGDKLFATDWDNILQKQDNSKQCYKLNSISLSQLCFMDMRADNKLTPQDSKIFKAYIFGGILGDDPPQDRASHLRCNFNLPIRQLGREQMTTDTAINVVKMVIQDCQELDQINFVNHPDLPTGEGVDKSINKSSSQLSAFDCSKLGQSQEGQYSSLNFKFVIDPRGANFVFNKRQVINYPLIHPGIHDILSQDKFEFNQLI